MLNMNAKLSYKLYLNSNNFNIFISLEVLSASFMHLIHSTLFM